MILPKVCSIARLTPDNDPDREGYAQVVGFEGVRIDIQPASDQLTAIAEGAVGDLFTAFVTVSGIKTGDQITVSGTNDKYTVRGVKNWYYGVIPHLELVLIKGDV